ncbi:hypothetical protein [Dyadobacter sp. 32]|uniref:hypothetical protein n=1 Tax=Dyadobacter sp. 32 TaxID=538966 RepID=UPI0011EFBD6C
MIDDLIKNARLTSTGRKLLTSQEKAFLVEELSRFFQSDGYQKVTDLHIRSVAVLSFLSTTDWLMPIFPKALHFRAISPVFSGTHL